MSFSDMMQSGRGPGVIGMLLALFVLLGFGILYMFVFDESLQDGAHNIGTFIRNQKNEIREYQLRAEEGARLLATAPKLDLIASNSAAIKRKNVTTAGRLEILGKKLILLTDELAAKQQKFESYKDEYRQFVRHKAKGELIAKLKTKSGETFIDVAIREVTPIGIQIRHSEGLKRIPYEDLPDDMIDYYQFDIAQKNTATAKEISIRKVHEAAAAVANEQMDQSIAAQRKKDAVTRKEMIQKNIVFKSMQIESLEREITSLRIEMSRASSEAASARSAGRIHLDRTSNVAGDIEAKQNRISSLRIEIAKLSSITQ